MDDVKPLVFRVGSSKTGESPSAKEVLDVIKDYVKKSPSRANVPGTRSVEGTGVYKFFDNDGNDLFHVSHGENLKTNDIKKAMAYLGEREGLAVERVKDVVLPSLADTERGLERYLDTDISKYLDRDQSY